MAVPADDGGAATIAAGLAVGIAATLSTHDFVAEPSGIDMAVFLVAPALMQVNRRTVPLQ
jgi:hypothetical protein